MADRGVRERRFRLIRFGIRRVFATRRIPDGGSLPHLQSEGTMIRKVLAIALVVLQIAGCASTGYAEPNADAAQKTFPARPDVAGLYIYTNEYMHRFWANVEVDGAPLGQLVTRSYLFTDLAPGRHAVTALADNTETLEFDAEAGTTYYVRLKRQFGWAQPGVNLEAVPEIDGQTGVLNARLVEPSYSTDDQTRATIGTVAGAIALGSLIGLLIFAVPAAGVWAVGFPH
jgi:hypothetical protein